MVLSGGEHHRGLAHDKARFLDKLSRFLPVGFYYKAFHKPKWLFPNWERLFRTLTGSAKCISMHRASDAEALRCTPICWWSAPGTAGLSAAITAARAGARVVLVDENPEPGGSLGYQRAGEPADTTLLDELLAQAANCPTSTYASGTYAAGCYADFWVPLVEPSGMVKLRARSMIVATGAQEQPAVSATTISPA